MICLSSKLPILQVGTHQTSNYDTQWLLRAIREGLERADLENTEVAHDIYNGILHYLTNDCPWKPLKIEDLYEKIEQLLAKIGLANAQSCIPMYSPEIRISVAQKLGELECPIELSLIPSLIHEMTTLDNYGVERIVLEEIREAVAAIIPAKRWTKQRQLLHDEIVALSVTFNSSQLIK